MKIASRENKVTGRVEVLLLEAGNAGDEIFLSALISAFLNGQVTTSVGDVIRTWTKDGGDNDADIP